MALTVEPTTPFNMGAAPQDQIFHSTWSGGQHVAVLYLFAPSTMMEQVRRPHLYNFAGPAAVAIQDTMNEYIKEGKQPLFDVARNQILSNALCPSNSGTLLPMRQLSEFWMFLLLLDNVTPRTVGGGLSGSNRLVYMGYCSEEPVNTIGLRATPNPHCHLHVTHRTQFAINESIAPYGSRNSVMPVVNADVLNGQFYSQLSNDNNLFLLHPKDLILNSVTSGDMSYQAGTGLHAASLPHAKQYASDMRSPNVHMNCILTALQHTVRNQVSASIMMPSVDRLLMPVHDLNATSLSFAEALGVDTPNHILGVDSSRPFSIAELQMTYPNIEIIPYKAPSSIVGTPIDPTTSSPITIISSYLSDTLPSMMTNLGIGAVVFRYSSVRLHHEAIFLNNEPEVEVQYIEPFIPELDQATARRWEMFLALMQRDVFPRIIAMFGDFQIIVNCSANAANYIQVQLLGRGTYCNPDEYFITHNPVGGLSTPLAGDSTHLTHNFQELQVMLSTVVPDAPFNVSM